MPAWNSKNKRAGKTYLARVNPPANGEPRKAKGETRLSTEDFHFGNTIPTPLTEPSLALYFEVHFIFLVQNSTRMGLGEKAI
ncbi:MAG: hypothetical protein JO002_09130 [Burkholderiaceae bacterium]|nr:hypothetical protein [Burkholderiaceae bacterium]